MKTPKKKSDTWNNGATTGKTG